MTALLRPFALLYGAAVAVRNFMYDKGGFPSYRSELPVISIGNITAGGTGKTPLTLFIAAELKRRGHAPAILSRGYGARVRSPKLVVAGDSAGDVGDEPLLMFNAGFPVVVSPDRAAGAKLIQEQRLGTCILLDDGLQHRKLYRAIDLVAVDCSSQSAVDQFLLGRLLPEGRFREQLGGALRRADAVVLNHRTPRSCAVSGESIRDSLPQGTLVFESYLSVSSITERFSGARLPEGTPVVALCALGNPEGFFRTVESAGCSVVKRVAAPDHAAFSLYALNRLAREYPGAALVCSAKDAVKLPAEGEGPPVYVLATELEMTDSGSLFYLLEQKLGPS